MFSRYCQQNLKEDTEHLLSENEKILLSELEEVIVNEDEASISIGPWKNNSATKPFLLDEIKACIEMVDNAKKNIPSYLELKKQTYYYSIAFNTVGMASAFCSVGSLAGAFFIYQRYLANVLDNNLLPLQNTVLNITKLRNTLQESLIKGDWREYGPTTIKDSLHKIWSAWESVNVNGSNHSDSINCAENSMFLQTKYNILWSLNNSSSPYKVTSYQYRYDGYYDGEGNGDWSLINHGNREISTSDYIQTRILSNDCSSIKNGYIAYSNSNNPCFLKERNYTHPITDCNLPSGLACDLYEQLRPYYSKIKNFL